MKKLHSVLTDESAPQYYHRGTAILLSTMYLMGRTGLYQRNTVFWSRCVQIGTIWLLTVCIWIRSLMSH